jgi:RNA polymerase sigma factor (sigma-70 family)
MFEPPARRPRHPSAPRGRPPTRLSPEHVVTNPAPAVHHSDAERFERLYRCHADRVYGLCLRMTGSRQRAADLVQDVFVRAWQKLHLLRDDTDAGAWVWRLATNVVFNDARARRRRDARFALVDDVDAALLGPGPRPAAGPAPFATPLPVRQMDLSTAIARLPDRARQIYVLHDVEGFSTEEIAERLGVAGGTVRAQLHRARSIMRNVLRP